MHPHRPIVFTYNRDKRIEQSYLYNQVIYPINFVSSYVPYLVEVHRTAILLHGRQSDASQEKHVCTCPIRRPSLWILFCPYKFHS